DLVHVSGLDIHLAAVLDDDVQVAAHRCTEMSYLAGRRAHLRSNVRRPAPAGFEDHPADGGLVEVDHVHPTATEIARVFGGAEVLSLQPWHAVIVPARVGTNRREGSGRVLRTLT